MTLHKAIEKLLLQHAKPMTTVDIANELNKNKWYKKKDGSLIQPFQIHGRTRNYPHLFNRSGSIVFLKEQRNNTFSTINKQVEKSKLRLSEISKDYELLEKVLINETNFKKAAIIDNIVPDVSGVYCIRIKNNNVLCAPFDKILEERKHKIIYIGVAKKSLKKRLLNQELRAKGHGTIFRSIGAVLGYRPSIGSLKNKANKRNYKFSISDENEIIEWINRNLIVNWVHCECNFENIETELIQKYSPLLNLAKNPLALKELSSVRAECVKIANS